MTTDREDATTRRYREASAALDERPAAATRAAILAAAARHVDAKPRAADAPRPTQRRRWPLAAAAAVLLSTLAVMVAQRAEQEMPTFTVPAERSDERVAVAPAAPPAPPTPTPTAPEASTGDAAGANGVIKDRRAAGVQPDARAKKSAPVGGAEEPAIAASRVPESRNESPAIAADAAKPAAQATRDQDAASSEARRASPSAPAPAAAPPPAVEQPARAEMGAASSAGEAARTEASPAYGAARKEFGPAPVPSSGTVRQEAQRDFERSSQDWLEHIVKLRGEGRHAEADVELKRFRERFPGVQVPSAALSPSAPATGTR